MTGSGRGAGGPDGPGGPGGRGGAPDPRGEAVDPDVDLHVPAQRAETRGRHGLTVVAVIGAGGALGALARHAMQVWLPSGGGGTGFPWGIFSVNLLGCALIGVLMALVGEGGREERAHALARPFLGVGVLGGFTTFSTYAADVALLLEAGRPGVAVAYLGGTVMGAVAAVWAGASAARAALAPGRGSGPGGRRPDVGGGVR